MKRTKKMQPMIEALMRLDGNISKACEEVGIDRKTHYKWLAQFPEYKEAIEDAEEKKGDKVEGKLMERIDKGDTTAIIFYCKTKLRNRGYEEKSEMKIDGDITIKVGFAQ